MDRGTPRGETNDIENGGARSAAASHSVLAGLLALALSACGGGGGGGGPPQTAVNACVTTATGQTLSGTLPGRGAGATYAPGAIPPRKGNVAIDIAGNFRYTPRTDFPSGDARGMDVFSYRLTDASGMSSEATITVLIGGAVRVMPLGDSITIGIAGTGTANEIPPSQQIGYRRKLYQDLENRSAAYRVDFVGGESGQGSSYTDFDRDHEGHAGWCDDLPCSRDTLEAHITAILNAHPPDVILLHIGTNDFSTDASGVRSILDKISSWAQANHPVSIFLARIIPSRGDPTRNDPAPLDVTTFNNNIRDVATTVARANVNVFMVDQQSALRLQSDPNKANPDYMTDHLHPNGEGYRRMATRWGNDLIASGELPTCD